MKFSTSLFVGVLALLFAGTAVAGSPDSSPGRTHTSIKRLSEERLAALHADINALKAKRVDVKLQSGLNDYRGILHAHAEDASHTGGTRPEMLEGAKMAGVDVVMLTDHYRPPKDFITDTWRGMHDGVLFIPGSESNGYLIYPENSVVEHMDKSGKEFVDIITEGQGLIFLSHLESKSKYSLEGLTGIEVYNRHYDAMDDMMILGIFMQAATDKKELDKFQGLLAKYPDEIFASQEDYPSLYVERWNEATAEMRVVGVNASDCHHNQVIVTRMVDENTVLIGTIVDPDDGMRTLTAAQRPGIPELNKGHKPGDQVVAIDIDPYHVAMRNASTHILAPELTEKAMRDALEAGHAYIGRDYLCDTKGFVYLAKQGDDQVGIMGDIVSLKDGLQLVAEMPLEAMVKLYKDGALVNEATTREYSFTPDGPGVYRFEAWLPADDEERVWIMANPIYVTE